MLIIKFNKKISILGFILTLSLILQIGLLIDYMIFDVNFNTEMKSFTDSILYMFNNNNNPNISLPTPPHPYGSTVYWVHRTVDGAGLENPSNINVNNASNFIGNFDFNIIKGIFTPVDHSIPVDTLINVHSVMHICLFILIIFLIVLFFYFYLNLLILFNRDYLLNNIKNKYLLLYIKYVIFRTRIDIFIIGLISLSVLVFISYILHYLIVHPIIFN